MLLLDILMIGNSGTWQTPIYFLCIPMNFNRDATYSS